MNLTGFLSSRRFLFSPFSTGSCLLFRAVQLIGFDRCRAGRCLLLSFHLVNPVIRNPPEWNHRRECVTIVEASCSSASRASLLRISLFVFFSPSSFWFSIGTVVSMRQWETQRIGKKDHRSAFSFNPLTRSLSLSLSRCFSAFFFFSLSLFLSGRLLDLPLDRSFPDKFFFLSSFSRLASRRPADRLND